MEVFAFFLEYSFIVKSLVKKLLTMSSMPFPAFVLKRGLERSRQLLSARSEPRGEAESPRQPNLLKAHQHSDDSFHAPS
jgi:hypothetical protein